MVAEYLPTRPFMRYHYGWDVVTVRSIETLSSPDEVTPSTIFVGDSPNPIATEAVAIVNNATKGILTALRESYRVRFPRGMDALGHALMRLASHSINTSESALVVECSEGLVYERTSFIPDGKNTIGAGARMSKEALLALWKLCGAEVDTAKASTGSAHSLSVLPEKEDPSSVHARGNEKIELQVWSRSISPPTETPEGLRTGLILSWQIRRACPCADNSAKNGRGWTTLEVVSTIIVQERASSARSKRKRSKDVHAPTESQKDHSSRSESAVSCDNTGPSTCTTVQHHRHHIPETVDDLTPSDSSSQVSKPSTDAEVKATMSISALLSSDI